MGEKQHVVDGPKLHVPVPDVSLGQLLYEELKKRSREDVAFKNETTGEWNSVGKILDDSFGLAQALTDFKFAFNSPIAICANNHINYPTVVLGALYAGIPLALMNPTCQEYELEGLLKMIEPEIVFCSKMNLEPLVHLNSKTGSIKKLVVIDDGQANNNKDVLTLDKFLIPTSTDFNIRPINAKEQVAFIMFSSGTTGLPKAITATHYSINATITAVEHPMVDMPLHVGVGLGVLPFFHIYGFYQLIASLHRAVPVIVMENFNPFDYLKCIEKYKIDTLAGVPPLLHFLAKSPIVDEYDLSCLKVVTCGSAPIGEDILQLVKSRLKLESVRNIYSSTESHMIIAITPPGSNNLKAVGKISPGTSLCIRDLETGRNLPANKPGEICTKSDMMMKGYYGNETATKESFTSDGWLRSGDIGYCDEEGYLYIVDRLKELIKYKGHQVPPSELESVLLTNPKVADVGVVGKPDQIAGELPVAFVVKEEGVHLTEDEVKSYVAAFLSKQKHLHGVYFVDQIPRTRSGKIIRRELKKLLQDVTKSKL